MPLSFRVQSQTHKELHRLADDKNETFATICRRYICTTHTLGGIVPYGDTMFNEFQLRTILDELSTIERSGTLTESEIVMVNLVREAAKEAVQARGYLLSCGD